MFNIYHHFSDHGIKRVTLGILVQKMIYCEVFMLITVILITIGVFVMTLFLEAGPKRYFNILLLRLMFSFYIITVFSLTLWNRELRADMHYNLELFWSYKDMMRVPGYFYYEEIILNILLFVPFGFLLAFLTSKKSSMRLILPLAFLLSLGIELSQLLFRVGLFEFDDIFNNTLGAVIGYGLSYAYHGLSTNKIDKLRRLALGLLPGVTVSVFFVVVYFVKK